MSGEKAALSKRELRSHLRSERRALSATACHECDAAIASRVLGLPAWEEADLVLAYLSVRDEVDTRALIQAAWESGKAVALPRVVPQTRRMDWYRFDDFAHVEVGPLGVEEPLEEAEKRLMLGSGSVSDTQEGYPARALALVPGLAFDRQGFRLGYGGGFYDTFLADFPGCSLGLCRASQLLNNLDELGVREKHDRPVQLVITQEEVIAPCP